MMIYPNMSPLEELRHLLRTEFHILTVGNSLLTHLQHWFPDYRRPMHDHAFWQEVLDHPGKLQDIRTFLSDNPAKFSAEVNSLEQYMKRYHLTPDELTLFLIGTRTPSNEVVRSALLHYFKTQGFALYDPEPTPAFMPEGTIDEHAVFRRGLIHLLEQLIETGRSASDIARRVCFNPTGGYKAHVIIMGVAAFLTGGTLYYIHEEFREIIEFPPVFYYPHPDELQAFGRMVQSRDITEEYDPDAMKRWIDFGLIAIDFNGGSGDGPRIVLTPRGKIWYEFFFRQMKSSSDDPASSGGQFPEA